MTFLFNNLKLYEYRRIYAGIGQQDIAKRVGMSQGNYSKIESGKISPDADQICKICSALKCHPGVFFTETGRNVSVFDKNC